MSPSDDTGVSKLVLCRYESHCVFGEFYRRLCREVASSPGGTPMLSPMLPGLHPAQDKSMDRWAEKTVGLIIWK